MFRVSLIGIGGMLMTVDVKGSELDEKLKEFKSKGFNIGNYWRLDGDK